MSNFAGYLLKSGDDIFPNEYISYGTFKSTPKSREEVKAYRDEVTRDLTRITATGTKTSFSFDTRAGLHLDDKIAIQEFFTSHEESALERKISLTYWNDESNDYETAYFYRPDIEFTIRRVTDDDIVYEAMTFQFVEY